MKKSIKITITEPCHEDWSKMTPTQKGKHCAVCTKEVIDFTQATDEQLYKIAMSGGNLCGRFTKNQLDREIQLQRKQGRSWASYAASLLIPAAILSTQEIKAQGNTQPTEQTDGTYTSLGISSLLRPTQSEISRKRIENDTTKNNQTRIIKGVASGEEGPIPMCTVYIEGTDKHINADLEGNYEIEATKGDVLIFSSLGYADVKMEVKNQATINATLKDIPLVIMGRLRVQPSKNIPH